jgi:hypothetical protein
MKAESGARVSSGTIAPLLRSPALAVLSVAVLAAITPSVIHEFIGHGSMCLAVGGHPTVVSTSMFACTVPTPVVAAGGPAANLLAGLICLDTVLTIGLAGLPLLVFLPRRGTSSITGNPFTGNAMLPVLTAVMWLLLTATLGHGITWGN